MLSLHLLEMSRMSKALETESGRVVVRAQGREEQGAAAEVRGSFLTVRKMF